MPVGLGWGGGGYGLEIEAVEGGSKSVPAGALDTTLGDRLHWLATLIVRVLISCPSFAERGLFY